MTHAFWTMVITWAAIVFALMSAVAASNGQALTAALMFFLFVSTMLVAIERRGGH